jgi:light-regulated signal transduction histidine kinase (bacteriophytochrome)
MSAKKVLSIFNGIGFGQEYSERILDLFGRLHGKSAYK